MSDGREKLVSQFGYSGRIDDQPTSRKADFDRPNNPFSLDPIAPTQGSTQKSWSSGGTAGILPAERARAQFDSEKMKVILAGSARNVARRKFIGSPVEDYDKGIEKHSLTRHEQYYEMWRNWREIHDPYLDKFTLKPHDMAYMTHNRVFGGGPGAHLGIFVGPIMSRGSPEQVKEFGERGAKMKIIGGYAQTELGHGSNVRGLETTATFDKDTDEFILDTPHLTSMKWWISNLGKMATHALVYAQLIIDGKEFGIHEYIVQIRDELHRPLPGVEVGNVGDTLGHPEQCTGFLRLNKVRVPRDRMLSKYQHVTRDGKYVKAERKRNPYTHYFTMLLTRAGIVRGTATHLARACTIAVRYSAVRTQGFKDANQGISHLSAERCVMDYQVQAYRLFKQLSAAYAYYFGGRWLGEMFRNIGDIGENVERVKEASATTAGLKSLVTLATLDGIEDLRKCCGGHGYLMSSGVANMLVDYMPNPTFEGDWVILYLQTARFLVKTIQEIKETGAKPPGQMDYLLPEFARDPEQGAKKSDYLNPEFVLRVLKFRTRQHVTAASDVFRADLAKGQSWGDAWAANGVILVQAARNHSLQFLYYLFADAVKQVKDPQCRKVLDNLVLCYGLVHIVDFEAGRVLDSRGSPEGFLALSEVLNNIRPNAVALVDAFDFPDSSLMSALGREDGNIYEALWESAKNTQLNQADPFLGFEGLLKPLLDQDFLKKGNAPMPSKSNL